jgi:hypothetical protein
MVWSLGIGEAFAAASVTSAEAWRARYERARTDLVAKRYTEASTELRALALVAPTEPQRELALELARLADAEAVRDAGVPEYHFRSTDELSLLYTGAFVYGLGSGAWLALVTKPGNLGTAILPFLAFTTASVGGVALADSYRPFRRGVPQAISTGLLVGLGEGVWIVGYQHARATNHGQARWSSAAVSTALWAGTSAGAIAGGLVGYFREPTPGRASFTVGRTDFGLCGRSS